MTGVSLLSTNISFGVYRRESPTCHLPANTFSKYGVLITTRNARLLSSFPNIKLLCT